MKKAKQDRGTFNATTFYHSSKKERYHQVPNSIQLYAGLFWIHNADCDAKTIAIFLLHVNKAIPATTSAQSKSRILKLQLELFPYVTATKLLVLWKECLLACYLQIRKINLWFCSSGITFHVKSIDNRVRF